MPRLLKKGHQRRRGKNFNRQNARKKGGMNIFPVTLQGINNPFSLPLDVFFPYSFWDSIGHFQTHVVTHNKLVKVEIGVTFPCFSWLILDFSPTLHMCVIFDIWTFFALIRVYEQLLGQFLLSFYTIWILKMLFINSNVLYEKRFHSLNHLDFILFMGLMGSLK